MECAQVVAWEITYFLKNYVTSEGAVSHNVLLLSTDHQLSSARYQVNLYANNSFE